MLVDPATQPDEGAQPRLQDLSERLLSRGDAARYLGVPVTTVYQWARTGRLSYKVTLGGHLRFARADLDAAIARARPRRPGDAPTATETAGSAGQ